MTGSWLGIVQGFAGMKTFNEELSFAPFIPAAWDRYSFNINYRDHHLTIEVNKNEVSISQTGPLMKLKVYGSEFELPADGVVNIPLMKEETVA